MMMHRQTCYFSGRVQGVGFRYTAQNIAQQYNVSGYVRNLPDGRVELVMEGPDEEMGHVVDEVKRKMAPNIRQMDSLIDNATGEFEQFMIRH